VALESTQPLTEMSTMNLLGWKGGRRVRLTTSPPFVLKMWEPQRLTTLCASTACYRDSFIFLPFYNRKNTVLGKRETSFLLWWKLCFLTNMTGGTEDIESDMTGLLKVLHCIWVEKVRRALTYFRMSDHHAQDRIVFFQTSSLVRSH
jgi:hypothetical protein